MAAIPPQPEASALGKRIQDCLETRAEGLFAALRQATNAPQAEALHQVRVQSRRLRAGLRLFAVLLPAGETKAIRRDVRRITRGFGEVRTLDVNLRLLRRAERKLPAKAAKAAAALRRQLRAQRREALAELRALTRSLQASRLEPRTLRMIRKGTRSLPAERLLAGLDEALDAARRGVRRRLSAHRKRGGSRAFHRLRIAVKRYRYALEAAEEALAAPVRKRIKAAKAVQDRMGDCHDLEVLMQALTAARKACAPEDKRRARGLEKALAHFEKKHRRRLAKCLARLQANRRWLKKCGRNG